MAPPGTASDDTAGLKAQRYWSIEETDENQWNNFVSQSANGTIFHRHEWLGAVEAGLDYEPRHVVVEKRGNPVAVMPNFTRAIPLPDGLTEAIPVDRHFRMVASSQPGYGGPIAASDERESLDLLFEALDRSMGRRDVFHLLQTPDLPFIRYGQYLQQLGYRPTFDTCLFFIDLDDGWETILGNMDKERRKDVRRANEQDFHVAVQPFHEAFDATYEHYVRNTERVDGSVHPRAFVEAVAERLGDRVLVFTAVVDGEDVGRYVHLLDEEASVLRHWLSAIPDEANYERYPSELLHERAIKYGIEHGFDRYGFGPTGAHFSNSVFRFKAKYGGTPVPLFKMEKGYSSIAWPLYSFARSKYAGEAL